MKRIFLTSILLITLLFGLTGCSNNENEGQSSKNNDDVAVEELELNGTGKINLKELINSPKLLNKVWYDVNMDEVKLYYGVNENDENNTKQIGENEFSAHFSNDGRFSTTIDGVTIDTKNEYVSINNYYNSRISMFSEDVPYENEFPENLKLRTFELSLTLPSDMTSEQLNETFDKSALFVPYLKEHNCRSLEDIMIALGFEETDKTMLEAMRNNVEYYAEYDSDYGKISAAYMPMGDMMLSDTSSHQFEINFEDETSWLKNISITSLTSMNGDVEVEELQVYFGKKSDNL